MLKERDEFLRRYCKCNIDIFLKNKENIQKKLVLLKKVQRKKTGKAKEN